MTVGFRTVKYLTQ